MKIVPSGSFSLNSIRFNSKFYCPFSLGWTIFDSLYVLGDSYYIVTDSPADFPDLREVLASEGGSAESATVGNIQFIGTKQATSLFGPSASHVAGVTVSGSIIFP